MSRLKFALFLLLGALPSADAYVLNYNSSGAYLKWNLVTTNVSVPSNSVSRVTKSVRYYLASDGYSVGNLTPELNALRASFGQWLSITNTHLKFEEAGLAPGPISAINTSDGSNVLFWAKSSTMVGGGNNISGSLGVAFTSSFSDGTLSQGDIVFNGVEFAWFTGLTNTASTDINVEGVALHEIGHFIGLRHSPVGGATMLYAGGNGTESLQIGLSQDEVTAARFIYPLITTNYGAIKGTVTRSGSGANILGAMVFVQDNASNIIAGTMSLTNGTYHVGSLPPGTYHVRVAPLDPQSSGENLLRPSDIASPQYSAADTFFLATTNATTVLAANTTNTINFSVISNASPFAISRIRAVTTSSGSYSWGRLGTQIRAGQSNYFTGVVSSNLPTGSATLSITGDGLTIGTTTFTTNLGGSGTGLHFVSVPVSVSSNATPGLRSFVLTQGTNVVYANGYFSILPAVRDDNFDGLDDFFQRTYFPVFTTNAAAPGADPDGDQFNNAAEFVAATIPTNSASYLAIQSVTRNVSGATVVWQSVNGKKYQVSTRTNMTTSPWFNIGSTVTASGSTASYLDSAATNAARFYRVQVLP